AFATSLMTRLTLGMDYWSLAWPRFLQGFSMGFIFVPLQTLTLATIRLERLGNATAAYNVVRNVGGSVGVALATTLLVRRSQEHQTTLAAHVNVWSGDTARRLKEWTAHFMSQGADAFTAGRQALALLDFLERGAGGGLVTHGPNHVVDVAPERAQPVPAGHIAVAHDHGGEVELGEAIERGRPVLRIAVAHEGRPADDGVARDDDLLPRQVDEHVNIGVGPAEDEEMDL